MPRPLPPTSRQVIAPRYINLHSHAGKRSGLRVACAGMESCRPDYHIERKSFPCFGVEFVLSGLGRVVLNGRHFPLYPGMLYCYGPNTAHEISSDSSQPMVKYFIDFFGDEARSLLLASNLAPGQAVQTLEMEGYRTLFEQILSEGSRMTASTEPICVSYLRILILKAASAAKPTAPRRSSSAELFFRCREYMDLHYVRLRNLDDIAAELRVRPAHLCRLFQQFNQPSPFQYLTHKKMSRAAELLMIGGLSVKNTALELGYEDPYHFSRLFKKRFGYAPQNFVKLSWRAALENGR